METQQRCKGCRNYLTVSPGQPCSVCYTVNNLNRQGNRHNSPWMFSDSYANPLSSNNYYTAPYGQPAPAAYTSYYAPQAYGSGYYTQQQQPALYSDGYYYSPLPPPVAPHALAPPGGYGLGYCSQYSQPTHQQKRAVLCGVTYKGHKKTLPASITNVRSMHQLLRKLGFHDASIHILTEEESDPTRTPTKHNILKELKWLTKGSRTGDSLVFYYAGHGSHVPDVDGDENDGLDEALCPVDYRASGKILDDELNTILVAPLPHGVTLHSIMDTCFSGTLLDLPFLCRVDWRGYFKWEEQHPSHNSQYGGTSGGTAICISACDDHQNSADTSVFTGDAIGALTYSFIKAVESPYKPTYGDLLGNMREIVPNAQQLQGLDVPFASPMSQEPQLSSSTRFQIYSKPFIL